MCTLCTWGLSKQEDLLLHQCSINNVCVPWQADTICTTDSPLITSRTDLECLTTGQICPCQLARFLDTAQCLHNHNRTENHRSCLSPRCCIARDVQGPSGRANSVMHSAFTVQSFSDAGHGHSALSYCKRQQSLLIRPACWSSTPSRRENTAVVHLSGCPKGTHLFAPRNLCEEDPFDGGLEAITLT